MPVKSSSSSCPCRSADALLRCPAIGGQVVTVMLAKVNADPGFRNVLAARQHLCRDASVGLTTTCSPNTVKQNGQLILCSKR